MRLVIDLQGGQGSSRLRGIGRYSRELALALARVPRGHDIAVLMNGTLSDGLDELTRALREVLPATAIHYWHAVPGAPEVVGPRPFRRAASEVLRAAALMALQPDVLLITSLFAGADDDFVSRWPSNVARPATAVVCYDLIPLIYRAQYLDGAWRDTGLLNWYFRCLHELSMADGLLAISEATMTDTIRHLGTKPVAITNILAGIEPSFRPIVLTSEQRKALTRRYGIAGTFVLFVGGGDPRKNEAALIKAYALLPSSLRAQHQLVIVGQGDAELLKLNARQLGLAADRVVPVRFVEEADLAALYSACALFVMPSLYEGFGLPAAEAMACGAPTIGSAAGSLPEVIGSDDALFDPTDPAAIARVMARGLTDEGFRARLVTDGLARIKRFTWSGTAERTWDFLERRFSVPPSRQLTGRLPRLAITSPLPPLASGIADYTRDLVPALARHYDVTLISPAGTTDDEWLKANFPHLTPAVALAEATSFDRVLHQIGNSEYHEFQLDGLLAALPGTATLHDSYLSGYALWRGVAGEPDHFASVLHADHGWPAVAVLRSQGWREAAFKFPCCGKAIAASLGIVQHSNHAGEILLEHGLHPGKGRWRRIELLRQLPVLPSREEARRRLRIAPDRLVIATFGSIAARKLPDLIARAWRRMPGDYRSANLAFVGEAVRDDETDTILSHDLKIRTGEVITLAGRVTSAVYRDWLAAADIAVQLRIGSRGETSAALADCLGAGLPTVVNRWREDTEMPEDVAIWLSANPTEEELAATFAALAASPAIRHDWGMRAQRWVSSQLDPLMIAEQYRNAIEKFYADPALRAITAIPLLEARLPQGTAEDFAAVARVVAANNPARQVPYLFLDCDSWNESPGQVDKARVLLAEHPPSIRVEAVTFENGEWRTAPDQAAKILNIQIKSRRRPLVPAADDVLLLCPDADGSHAPRILALASLRRLRLQVIVPNSMEKGPFFDGTAGGLATESGSPCAFPGRALPDWLLKERLFANIGVTKTAGVR